MSMVLSKLQRFENRLKLITPKLIRKKPGLLLRAACRLFVEKFTYREPIRGVLFAPQYACNLNCEHCCQNYFSCTHKPLLSLEEKKEVISQCLDMGVLAFDFIGGETSLSKEFPELVKACLPSKTYIALASNGYDMSEEKIRYFWNIGVDKLSISVDSWVAEEHDRFRGVNGSHGRALKTIALCRKIGMGVHIGMVVSRHSTRSDSFKKVVEYALREKISLGLIPAMPVGKWQGNYDVLITPEDRKIIDKLHQQYPLIITGDHYGRRYGGCPAFNEVLAVTAYGDVMPCDFIHASFGNLRNETLHTIVERGRKVKYFNGRYRGCLAAENRDFIENCLPGTYGAVPYPIDAAEIFDELKKDPAPL